MRTRFTAKRRLRRHPANARHSHSAQRGIATGATAGLPIFLQRSPVAAEKMGDRLDETAEEVGDRSPSAADAQLLEPSVAPVPAVSEEGKHHEMVAFANNLRLQGRTDASFSNNFRTENVTTTRSSDCEGCPASECVHVTGTLVSTFTVTTTVTLPSVSDFPSLTACQRQRVQDAITNILAPHEQQHVVAFQTYTGTVRTPFDLTLCRGDFATTIRSMHDSIEQGRRSSAQAASDALDPFHFDVDLNCTD